MAIHKLEETAVRAIGASQVLTDPATVVKELIDNALDAHATSIAVEIHSNTLDIIQVKDNGHGIAPEDRSVVARPNCTSKLTDIDDLQSIGGSSLGFRGQALASAAEMSGSLTISTRVEGEEVGTALKIDRRGEVVGQERASLPPGTTVRITDFIKTNPVRRQVTLKNADGCLKKIKQTLQAYAFARPHVRLSLRVLKGKNEKGNWMYAPKPGGGLEDAALKIIGSACASQCTWSVVEEHGFVLQAFLPRSDANVAKISTVGSFISIDARPVSSSRGTIKQIVKIFRESLKGASSMFDGVKDPFICMQIACPSASYDANVEPAKDDVLFEDPDLLVGAARRMFSTMYPTQEAAAELDNSFSTTTRTPVARSRPELSEGAGFVTSLEISPDTPSHQTRVPTAQATQLQTPILTSDISEREDGASASARPQRTFRSNMYGCDEEDLDMLDQRPTTGRTEAELEEIRQTRKDVSVSNPWVAAKLHSTLRRSVPSQTEGENAILEHGRESAMTSSPLVRGRPHPDLGAQALPTPRPSSPLPPVFHPSDHVPDVRFARDGRLIGSQSLPPAQSHVPFPSTPHADLTHNTLDSQPPRKQPVYDYALLSHTLESMTGTPLNAIPETSHSHRSPQKQLPRGQLNLPFVSPMLERPRKEQVWFDHLEEGSVTRPNPRRPYQAKDSEGLVVQGELGDLVDDPRPLTPPRRNRDIRDFVSSVDLTGADSVSSIIELRNYSESVQKRSTDMETPHPQENAEENISPTRALLSGRGFVPASELAALEARLGPLNKEAAHPPKRRKTHEHRALREVSGNAAEPAEVASGEEEYRPIAGGNRKASRRQRTTESGAGKVQRTKSSRLPLERIPLGQRMHNINVNMTTAAQDLSRLATHRIEEEGLLLDWNQPAVDAYDAFSTVPAAEEMQRICVRLRELLSTHVPGGEMVRDLDGLVSDAFTARAQDGGEEDALFVG